VEWNPTFNCVQTLRGVGSSARAVLSEMFDIHQCKYWVERARFYHAQKRACPRSASPSVTHVLRFHNPPQLDESLHPIIQSRIVVAVCYRILVRHCCFGPVLWSCAAVVASGSCVSRRSTSERRYLRICSFLLLGSQRWCSRSSSSSSSSIGVLQSPACQGKHSGS